MARHPRGLRSVESDNDRASHSPAHRRIRHDGLRFHSAYLDMVAGILQGMMDWVFRNRQTGRITIVQSPNPVFSVFFLATLGRAIARPSGTAAIAFNSVAHGALVAWALDELFRGVNPWRRLVGGATLAWQARRVLTWLTSRLAVSSPAIRLK